MIVKGIRRIGYIFACLSILTVASSVVAFAQDEMVEREYETISAEELKQLIDSKADVVIVDNAPKEGYDEGHIPGAISFPWVNQIRPPVKLPRNKPLILYCPCTAEEDSTDMANKLAMFGYYNIKLLKGGWFRWEELGYPIEKSTSE